MTAAIFGAVVFVGALFHLTFVPFYAVLAVVDSGTACVRHGLRRGVLRSVGLHLAPTVALGALLFSVARALGHGTGPLVDYVDTSVDTLTLVAGGPLVSPSSTGQTAIALGVAFVVLALLARALVVLVRSKDPHILLLGGLVVGIPLLTALLAPRIFLPRYLYLAVWAGHLILARFATMSGEGEGGRAGKGFATRVFIGALVACNMWFAGSFVVYGRGNLRGAVEAACALGSPERTVIGGTHPFRDRMMITYFAPKVCGARQVTYTPIDDAATVDALLVQSQDTAVIPAPSIDRAGNRYTLVAVFPFAGLSGWGWYLYRPEAIRP